MANFYGITWERTGDSRWYIKHIDIPITPEEMIAWIKALDLELLG